MVDARQTKFENCAIDDASLLNIARILRGCAELEDILTLFICTVAEINESRAIVLLGRMPYSKRCEVARYLAKMRSDESLKQFNLVFNSGLEKVATCRNDVAHGVLLGVTTEGEYGFLTQRLVDPLGDAAVQIVKCYSPNTLAAQTEAISRLLPHIEEALNVQHMRRRRYGKTLAQHS